MMMSFFLSEKDEIYVPSLPFLLPPLSFLLVLNMTYFAIWVTVQMDLRIRHLFSALWLCRINVVCTHLSLYT